MGLNIYFYNKCGDEVEYQEHLGNTHNLNKIVDECGKLVGYACTERQSVDKKVDGKVVKTAVFVHAGMYWAN